MADEIKDEVMKEEELEQVAGGEEHEYTDLVYVISNNSAIPGSNQISYDYSQAGIDKVTKILSQFGITAVIHANPFNDNALNEYKDNATGRSLNHAEVRQKLMNYRG